MMSQEAITPLIKTPIEKVLHSKYTLFGIFSFVDVASRVRICYFRRLSKRFKELADLKEEETYNMLVKTDKVFNFKDYRSLEKIDFLSLSDFKCGIIIQSTLLIRLISHLRPYK